MRDYPVVTVTEKAEKSACGGHPWVYADEVINVTGEYKNGDIVDIRSRKGKYLGTGFINDNSKIRIRIISRNANDKFDDAFWARRVKYALDYRRTIMPGEDFSCCRLIFGEADGFPGLTVDRFENVLVAEVLSLGIEQKKSVIYDALLSELPEITALYERSDSDIRTLEGMEKHCGFCFGGGDGFVTIKENGILYNVDYINGQKTGFFLDQKYNRAAVGKIAKGKRVLDCFTHTGAFALNAAKGGAESVTAVDISEKAIDDARKNAEQNNLIVNFVCADVFDYLTKLYKENNKIYDFIILDPPAFTKSRDTIKDAMRGYKEINLKAMRLLPRGGYLATCSCSHFMRDSIFCQMLHAAAEDAGVSLRQIEARQQAPDHPILWNVPETDYLKFYIFQIV
jgi:23S rRNA (cytosine1962-C5)-methyltransferase